MAAAVANPALTLVIVSMHACLLPPHRYGVAPNDSDGDHDLHHADGRGGSSRRKAKRNKRGGRGAAEAKAPGQGALAPGPVTAYETHVLSADSSTPPRPVPPLTHMTRFPFSIVSRIVLVLFLRVRECAGRRVLMFVTAFVRAHMAWL